jgi:hypothetical protein
MIRFSRSMFFAAALACGMLAGEAALRPAQEAHADDWQYYISPQQVYCEGCCAGGSVLCCSAPHRCSAPGAT